MAVGAPEIALDSRLLASAARLTASESHHLWKTIDLLRTNPDHPGLNLHPVKQARSRGIYTARVTQELRLLLVKEGNVLVLAEVGHHDAIYDKAQRSQFVINAGTGYVGLVTRPDPGTSAAEGHPEAEPQPERRSIFDHWTDGELLGAGLPGPAVPLLRGCSTEDDLLAVDLVIPEIELAIELLGITPEQWRAPAMVGVEAESEEQLRRAINEHGPLHGLSPLFTAEELASLAAEPIEAWMVFLHPSQRSIIERGSTVPAAYVEPTGLDGSPSSAGGGWRRLAVSIFLSIFRARTARSGWTRPVSNGF